MSVIVDRPLPYLPIKIVDISPYRSSIRRRPSVGPRRPDRVRVAAGGLLLAAVAAIVSIAASAPVAIGPSAEFRLGPGHAMPLVLESDQDDDVRGGAMTGFHLAPGHAMPVSLLP